jgi:hypothetical protein
MTSLAHTCSSNTLCVVIRPHSHLTKRPWNSSVVMPGRTWESRDPSNWETDLRLDRTGARRSGISSSISGAKRTSVEDARMLGCVAYSSWRMFFSNLSVEVAICGEAAAEFVNQALWYRQWLELDNQFISDPPRRRYCLICNPRLL